MEHVSDARRAQLGIGLPPHDASECVRVPGAGARRTRLHRLMEPSRLGPPAGVHHAAVYIKLNLQAVPERPAPLEEGGMKAE
jgi:hypothetical protein